MADPTSALATSTVVAAGVILPVLPAVTTMAPQIVILGISLGLRADVLLAGFAGSLVAIGFFNTVPSTGDTWRELVRTTARRVWWCMASSLTAGYLTPLMLLLDSDKLRIPESLMLGVAFVAGTSAQRLLARFIRRAEAKADAVDKAIGGGDAA